MALNGWTLTKPRKSSLQRKADDASNGDEMASRLKFVKPQAVEKRFKVLLSGASGTGKTMAAISFPAPAVIDTERGSENKQYVEAIERAGGMYLHTTDIHEIAGQVQALLTERHDFKTLVIDSLTLTYANALDSEAVKLEADDGKDGTAFGRNKKGPDRVVRRVLNMCYQLDMNVVFTSHSKALWKRGAGGSVEEAGTTFDCYGKIDYVVDLWLETQMRGMERMAMVRKSRVEAFPLFDVFPLSYDAIAERYGRAVLERGAEPVVLASPDQVAQLTHLVEVVRLDVDVVQKWLDKANAESFADMPADAISKCITFVESKVNQPAPATAA